MRLACLLTYPTYRLEVDGRVYTFDWSEWFGPTLLNRRGNPTKAPPERSHFWDALQWWQRQGKRVTQDGDCLWAPMGDDPIILHDGRRSRIAGYRVPAWAEGQGTPEPLTRSKP